MLARTIRSISGARVLAQLSARKSHGLISSRLALRAPIAFSRQIQRFSTTSDEQKTQTLADETKPPALNLASVKMDPTFSLSTRLKGIATETGLLAGAWVPVMVAANVAVFLIPLNAANMLGFMLASQSAHISLVSGLSIWAKLGLYIALTRRFDKRSKTGPRSVPVAMAKRWGDAWFLIGAFVLLTPCVWLYQYRNTAKKKQLFSQLDTEARVNRLTALYLSSFAQALRDPAHFSILGVVLAVRLVAVVVF